MNFNFKQNEYNDELRRPWKLLFTKWKPPLCQYFIMLIIAFDLQNKLSPQSFGR